MSKVVAIWNPDTGIQELHPYDRSRPNSLEGIKNSWASLSDSLKHSSLLNEFRERLDREWSIETGAFEKVYELDRGVTITLIEQGFKAELIYHGATNKPVDFVVNVLRDQYEAIESIRDFVARKTPLTTSYVKQLHALLLSSQSETDAVVLGASEREPARYIKIPLLKGEWKQQPNSPDRDGVKYEYCPPVQVASEMDRLIRLANEYDSSGVSPDMLAAWLHHRFAQIHPFQDGNGRVARALASYVFLRAGLFPLIIQRNEPAYIPALEKADNGDLSPLIDLFGAIQRQYFLKASQISEQLFAPENELEVLLTQLEQNAAQDRAALDAQLRTVFALSDKLLLTCIDQFRNIENRLVTILQSKAPAAWSNLAQSTQERAHYFHAQIVKHAREHYSYYANMNEDARWVALTLTWTRKAKIVFPFHALGRPFSGSMVCAPFIEFRETSDSQDAQVNSTPIAKEAFVFHHSDKTEALATRFQPWLQLALNAAIAELARNL